MKGNVKGGNITKTETGYTLTGGTPCDVTNTNSASKIEIASSLQEGAEIGVYNYTNGNVITTGYKTYHENDAADKFFFSNDATKDIVKDDSGELKFGDHVHDFTYSVDGATITATCDKVNRVCLLQNGREAVSVNSVTDLIFGVLDQIVDRPQPQSKILV